MLDRVRTFVSQTKPNPTDVPKAVTSGRSHILRNIAIGLAAFLVLIAVVGFFVVPPIAKHYLVKNLSEQLGREVSIQDIDVNPFAMKARVKGFTVKERGGSEPFFSFEELALNLEYRSIIRRAPVLKQILLKRPYLHVVRFEDGKTYNFSDLVAKFSAKRAPQDRDHKQPLFSLHNIRLFDGRVAFDDRPLRAKHAVTEINVAIPFLSNLPYMVDEYVQPAFSAKVNGSPFASEGRTKPFRDTLETSLDLDLDQLDLPRYFRYIPVELGFNLASGLMSAQLSLSFITSQSKAPLLQLKGDVKLEKVSMTEPGGEVLLNFAALDVPIQAIDVFGKRYALGAIGLRSPEVFVRRSRDGRLNWLTVLQNGAGNGQPPAEGKAGQAIQLSVAEFKVAEGQVHVTDEVPAKPFRRDLSGIQLSVKQFAQPQAQPALIEAALRTDQEETVTVAGNLQLSPLASEGTVEAKKVRLANYEPYYEHLILYRIEDGIAELSTKYAFASRPEGSAIRLSAFNLGLASVRMRKPGESEDFLRAKTAQISNASVDVNKLELSVGEFTTRDGFLNIIRERDGTLNATRILPAPEEARAESRRTGTPWLITLERTEVQKWKVAFTDLTLQEPVKLVADNVTLKGSGISNQKNRKGTLALAAKLNETGKLSARGPISLNPLNADLQLEVAAVELLPFQPYFTDKINILLTSGDASLKGDARLSIGSGGSLGAAFNGDLTLANFASVDKALSEDFLKCNTLFLGGITYAHHPMSLDIAEVALSDFYSRIVIYPEGRVNLQDIVVKQDAGTLVAAEDRGPASGAAGGKGDSGPAPGGRGDAGPAAGGNAPPANQAPAARTVVAAQAAPAATAALPAVRIGKVTLQGGDVNFTDLFIKPNYSADLSEIGGSVLGLSSELNTTADVELRGRFAKTAPVEIKGKINPLIRNLFLDLGANVRDIELGPFSPYSGKYVGYAIEKGKMSFDVQYKVENRKLAAQNKLVLNQLTFGEKVQSPQATKLPVLLAVALLKDRNGVIDVNLPISGSLDDPKFSIGGIVIQVIFNLIEKAVTAPFALIGAILGGSGGEQLSYVEFDPGRSTLSPPAQEKLGKLQIALVDRPGLKLDIAGRADPASDAEGLRRYRFEQQVKAQKMKDVVKQGSSVRAADEVKVEQAEYDKYLARAYKDAKFPKPRNVIGFSKDLPPAEMEKLMLANTQASDDDLIQLANQRAQAAKDFLTRDGKVPPERVFLLAPKVEAGKGDDKVKATRADFSLK